MIGFQSNTSRLIFTALGLAFGNLASAELIQVSLGDKVGSVLQGPTGASPTTWNDWWSMDSSLKNSAGSITSVTFSAGGEGPHSDWWCDLGLLEGGVHTGPGVMKPCVISGLVSGAVYDLYLASSWGNKVSNTSFQTANPSNTPSPQFARNAAPTNATTWVRGTNFVLFQDLRADGSGQITLTYQGVTTDGILNGFQLVGPLEMPTTTYQSWVEDPLQRFTAASNDGPLDDPDGDGIVNLLEFALGGMPLGPMKTDLPLLKPASGKWIFEYDRSDAARPPNTTQVIEYSADLVTWTGITVPITSSNGVRVFDNGAKDRVQVDLPAAGEQMFARLKVIQ